MILETEKHSQRTTGRWLQISALMVLVKPDKLGSEKVYKLQHLDWVVASVYEVCICFAVFWTTALRLGVICTHYTTCVFCVWTMFCAKLCGLLGKLQLSEWQCQATILEDTQTHTQIRWCLPKNSHPVPGSWPHCSCFEAHGGGFGSFFPLGCVTVLLDPVTLSLSVCGSFFPIYGGMHERYDVQVSRKRCTVPSAKLVWEQIRRRWLIPA